MTRAHAFLTGFGVTLPALLLGWPALAADDREAHDPANIQVIGHPDPVGLLPDQTAPKSVSAISTDFITKQAPTLSAFQLVNMLPGATVATTDPYGLSAMSSLTLRGLGQDSIGVLMEGAPQNDIGYYYAYPSQFADTENLRSITLSQGSVDMDSPVTGAVGGLLSLKLNDPKDKSGGLVTLSMGSYDQRRIFARIDSGTIGESGLKAFVSYSNNRADNWRGAGYDTRQHIDAKIVNEWGNDNHAGLALSLNSATTSNYPSPTMADWKAYGRDFNHDKRYSAGNTNYWRLYRAPFHNAYASAPLHLTLNDQLTLDSTSYLQFGYGNSPYGTELSTTGNYLGTEEITQPIAIPGAVNGVATVLGNWTGKQFRAGDVTKLTLKAGAHRIVAGVWFDYGIDRVLQTYTPVGEDGRPVDAWGRPKQAIRTEDGRLLAYENQRTKVITKGFFLSDSIDLTPQLGVDVGFKGVHVLRRGRNYLPGPQGKVRTDSFAALPRAAIHYKVDDRQQIFANIATSFRAPTEFTLYNSYYGGDIVSHGTSDLKNEYAVSQEIGYRYIGPSLSFSVTGFHYHFRNRQVATVVNSGGALVNSSVNAGTQNSYGVDAEIDYRPAKGVSIYASGEYLHARLGSDLPVGTDFLPTKGKHAITSPTFQFAVGSTFDTGRFFGSSAMKYVGRQYATFMNDERIKGYATLDLSIGVHLAGLIDAQPMDLRLNAINVTNPRVLSGVQAISSNAQDVIGRNGTIISGTAPTYYIGSGRAFVVSLSRGF